MYMHIYIYIHMLANCLGTSNCLFSDIFQELRNVAGQSAQVNPYHRAYETIAGIQPYKVSIQVNIIVTFNIPIVWYSPYAVMIFTDIQQI